MFGASLSSDSVFVSGGVQVDGAYGANGTRVDGAFGANGAYMLGRDAPRNTELRGSNHAQEQQRMIQGQRENHEIRQFERRQRATGGFGNNL